MRRWQCLMYLVYQFEKLLRLLLLYPLADTRL